MATSGTFTFAPTTAEAALQAFRRIGISRANVTAEMLLDASNEANTLMASWANKGPNLWTVDTQTVSLVQGTATYTVDPATIDILNAYLTYGSPSSDLVMTAIGRDTYAAYPQKTQQGRPTTYWFDRIAAPTLTVWPVPDGAYTMTYNRFRITQDMSVTSGTTPELPNRWIDAFIWGLAEPLAFIYAPDRAAIIAAKAKEAYSIAATEDVEDVPMRFGLALDSYYR